MKKALYVFFCSIIFAACQYEKGQIETEKVTKYESQEEDPIIAGNEMLNTKEMYISLFEKPIDFADEKLQAIPEVWQEPEYVPYEGIIFPASLVREIQEVFVQSGEMQDYDQKKGYFKFLEENGAEQFKIAKEDFLAEFADVIEEEDLKNCISIYVVGEKYLMCFDSEGSFGGCYIELLEYSHNDFSVQDEFETQNYGWGRVIEYEGQYYYIFLQYNYNLKNYDGVRIHKLGLNAAKENILIRLLPKQYKWEEIYNDSGYGDAVSNYVEHIKEELVFGEYLEKGTVNPSITVYIGDESLGADKIYYETDFSNANIPVYFERKIFQPSNTYSTIHMKLSFFMDDAQTGNMIELKELKVNESIPVHGNELLQMWFKELEEEVYIFQVYHLNDYNYLLNVMYVGGGEVTLVKQAVLIPEKEFSFSEGQEFICF